MSTNLDLLVLVQTALREGGVKIDENTGAVLSPSGKVIGQTDPENIIKFYPDDDDPEVALSLAKARGSLVDIKVCLA